MIYSVSRKSPSRLDSSSITVPEVLSGDLLAVAESSSRSLSSIEDFSSPTDTHAEQLAARILHRIDSRLPCRVRHLRVFVSENAVILEGCCSTYYTKQIAQHTAMGVLEYERLINNIEVRSVK